MTPDQADQVVGRLLASFRGRMGTGVRQAWADALTDLPADAVNAAVDHLARTEQRMPTLAAVRQAAANTSPSSPGGAPPPARWQVLETWTEDGRPYAEPRRWHHSEPEALIDYHAATLRAAQRGGTVELLRHEEGRPVQIVERHG